MRHLIAALVLGTALGCTTIQKLEDPGPVTEGDRIALDAMVQHGAEILAKDELGEAAGYEWVEHLAVAYTALRFSAGAPIFPEEDETPIEAALREALKEISAAGYAILEEEDWAISAVRVYAGWRFATGDPIQLPKQPPEGAAG